MRGVYFDGGEFRVARKETEAVCKGRLSNALIFYTCATKSYGIRSRVGIVIVHASPSKAHSNIFLNFAKFRTNEERRIIHFQIKGKV